MSDFDTYECGTCSESFRAHPSARAAENGYCSPVCEREGNEL